MTAREHTQLVRQIVDSKVIRAAAYIRVSDTEGEENDYSPDSQKEAIQAYAREQGYFLSEKLIFFDAFTGKVYRERLALRNAQDAAKRGEYEILIVFKFNRLSRNDDHMLIIMQEFTLAGVKVVSVKEKIEDTRPGKLMMHWLAWQSQSEVEDIK